MGVGDGTRDEESRDSWSRWAARLERWRRTPGLGHAFALASVLVASALRAAIAPLVEGNVPFITYLPAVLVTAFVAGFRPAIVAILLSGAAAWFLVLGPAGGSPALLLLFLAVAAITAIFAAIVNGTVERLLERDRRALAAERREARQQELVIQELEHRTRNVFGLVKLLALHSLGDAPAATRKAFLARLDALSTAYAMDVDGRGVTLRDVLDRLLRLHAGRIAISGCDLALNPAGLQQLTLIVHELHTNAMKHGALSVDGGRVEIAGSVTDGNGGEAPAFTFTWQEQGGPPVVAPTRVGFGQVILRQAPSLGGARIALDYAPQGLRYAYVARLAKIAA